LAAAALRRAQAEIRRSRRCRKSLDMAITPFPYMETNCHIWKALAISGKFSFTSTLRWASS
jgi:hypothetical protein